MIVEFTKAALKDIDKIPDYLALKLQDWSEAVMKFGIEEVRKAKGYHDEPLRGDRKGQRSIRLSRSYRAIYVESSHHKIRIITVIQVNKHEY